MKSDNRWLLLSLLVLSIFIAYLGRMSVSVALPFVSSDMAWTIKEQGSLGGILLGIFLVSYGLSNIFFSPLIDIYGAKNMLVLSILVWSGAVFMGALWGHMYKIFLLSRILLGLGQGVLFPCATKFTAEWFPPEKRGRANSLFVSGGPMGVLAAPLLMMPVILHSGWESSFYMVGMLGVILIIPIIVLIPKGSTHQDHGKKAVMVDMRELIKDRDFQLILAVSTAMTSVWWGMSLWVPTYLVEAQGVSLADMTMGASLPYLGAIIGMYTGAFISDITGKRRDIIVGSLSMSALFLVILTIFTITHRTTAIVLLFFVFFFGQMGPPIFFTLIQDKVPQDKLGAATGVMNGVCNGFGIAGPLLVGFIVAFTASYNTGLLSLAVLSLIGAGIFRYFPE